MKDIKIYYTKANTKLNFDKFNVFVLKMQKWSDKYRSYTTKQYYLFLIKDLLYNKFMKTFFETI